MTANDKAVHRYTNLRSQITGRLLALLVLVPLGNVYAEWNGGGWGGGGSGTGGTSSSTGNASFVGNHYSGSGNCTSCHDGLKDTQGKTFRS